MDILHNQSPDEIEYDTSPILKFRRPTVNSLRSLFEARILFYVAKKPTQSR